MNLQVRFKAFGILILLFLLLGTMPAPVAHSQMGGGYDCGQWTFVDRSGRLGGWWFNPWPFDGKHPSWVMRNVPPDWRPDMDGAYTRIWHPVLDESYELGPMVLDIGSYKVVSDCEPIMDLWSDHEMLAAGECTQLHWNVDMAGLDAVYLENEMVDPSGERTICPASDTGYALRVTTSGSGDYASMLDVKVFSPTNTPYPTDTPEPTLTPVPPTRTQVPPSATHLPPSQTAIPPSPKPISTLIVPAPATQSSVLELSIVPITQRVGNNPITLSDGKADNGDHDCFIAAMSMALEYFKKQGILDDQDTTEYRSLVPIVRGTTPATIDLQVSVDFVSNVTHNKLSGGTWHTPPDNFSRSIETELRAGRPVVSAATNGNLLAARWTGMAGHAILIYGLHDERVYYVDPWDGARYDMPIQGFVNAVTFRDGAFFIAFERPQQ